MQRDAQRQAFRRVERRPTAGVSLELAIDSYIQHIAERSFAPPSAGTMRRAAAS